MAIPHAYPGMPVNLLEDGEPRGAARSTALLKDQSFEAIRLVIPKGHEIPQHQVEGPITVQCLQGRIAFTCRGTTHDMAAGHWLFLLGDEPHALAGIEDAVVLLTILFPRRETAT